MPGTQSPHCLLAARAVPQAMPAFLNPGAIADLRSFEFYAARLRSHTCRTSVAAERRAAGHDIEQN